MSSPTIKDVADLAGVSISTVSRVMNNSKPVSPEARKKVENAIRELDFKRNELARSLVMQRSNLIGVLVEDLGISYMAEIIRGVEEVGRMYDYDMLLNSSYGNLDQEKEIVDFMLRKQAEAIIMITEDANSEVIHKLRENENSFILLDKYYTGTFKTVTIDYKQASREMTSYLIENGHEEIVFLADDLQTRITEEKIRGFKEAMEARGLEAHIFRANGSQIKDGFDATGRIEKVMDQGLSCIYTSLDDLAIGSINYLLHKGIRVPEDISVAGFGDSRVAKAYTPSLTTVHEPNYDIGAVAMRRIIKELREEEKIDSNAYLPVQIMKRNSVKNIK